MKRLIVAAVLGIGSFLITGGANTAFADHGHGGQRGGQGFSGYGGPMHGYSHHANPGYHRHGGHGHSAQRYGYSPYQSRSSCSANRGLSLSLGSPAYSRSSYYAVPGYRVVTPSPYGIGNVGYPPISSGPRFQLRIGF